MVHGHSAESFAKDLELQRNEKDYFFQADADSPIPTSLRGTFRGLEYFAPDPAYRFPVHVVRLPTPEPVTLATSKGVPRPMLRYGYLEFEVAGVRQRLYAYKAVPQPGHHHEHESLFVPFRDATSGKESYGAARYLDLEEGPSGEVVLDFVLRVQRRLRVPVPAQGELALRRHPRRREDVPRPLSPRPSRGLSPSPCLPASPGAAGGSRRFPRGP